MMGLFVNGRPFDFLRAKFRELVDLQRQPVYFAAKASDRGGNNRKTSEKSGTGLIIAILITCLVAIPGHLIAHGWKASKEAADRHNPIAKDQASVDRGRKLFEQNCAICHDKQGLGDGMLAKNLKTRPTNLKERARHHSDGDFAWKIANGRGDMPPFKNQLTESQIWDLVNFIRSL